MRLESLQKHFAGLKMELPKRDVREYIRMLLEELKKDVDTSTLRVESMQKNISDGTFEENSDELVISGQFSFSAEETVEQDRWIHDYNVRWADDGFLFEISISAKNR